MAGESKSTESRRSRYVQGGASDVYPDRLGWWERREIPTSDDDISLIITPIYNRRPDLLAADLYGTPSMQWLVLQYNNILDINTEFVEGKELVLPSEERVMMDLLNQPIGGVVPEDV